jgi:hypothetical protein
MMPRRLLFPAILVVLGAVVALLGSEAVYRISSRYVCVRGDARVYRPDLAAGWIHEPGATGEHVGCVGSRFEFRNQVRINSAGLHDVERGAPALASEGRHGVLVLGDSMTEALQVPLESNFVRRVQSLPEMADTVLWNAGTALYGPDNSLLWYRHYGRAWRPDTVVFVWNLANDIAEVDREIFEELYRNYGQGTRPTKPFASRAEDGSIVFDDGTLRDHLRDREVLHRRLEALERDPGWWEWARRHFYLLRRLGDLVAGEARAEASQASQAAAGYPGQLEVYFEDPPPRWERAWTLAEALIDELAREVEADGARFVVLLLPPKFELAPDALDMFVQAHPALARHALDAGRPRRRARAWLATRPWAWEDATAELEALRSSGRAPFFRVDAHLTPAGHEAVARALAAPLRG